MSSDDEVYRVDVELLDTEVEVLRPLKYKRISSSCESRDEHSRFDHTQ